MRYSKDYAYTSKAMVNRCPVSVSTLECECNVKAAHSNI